MARFAPSTGLLSAAALAATAWAAPAPGQGLDIRTLFNAPDANTAGAPAPTAGVQDWSGESGASNHPLMTAQAIRAAAANFRNCLAGLWPLAERRGVSRAVFEANVAGLTPDLRFARYSTRRMRTPPARPRRRRACRTGAANPAPPITR